MWFIIYNFTVKSIKTKCQNKIDELSIKYIGINILSFFFGFVQMKC